MRIKIPIHWKEAGVVESIVIRQRHLKKTMLTWLNQKLMSISSERRAF